MDEQLRERIADIIVEREDESPLERAEAILQIPEIKEALELRLTALRRYGEALRPMSAEAMYGAGLANAYANSSPLEQFVTKDDLPPSA